MQALHKAEHPFVESEPLPFNNQSFEQRGTPLTIGLSEVPSYEDVRQAAKLLNPEKLVLNLKDVSLKSTDVLNEVKHAVALVRVEDAMHSLDYVESLRMSVDVVRWDVGDREFNLPNVLKTIKSETDVLDNSAHLRRTVGVISEALQNLQVNLEASGMPQESLEVLINSVRTCAVKELAMRELRSKVTFTTPSEENIPYMDSRFSPGKTLLTEPKWLVDRYAAAFVDAAEAVNTLKDGDMKGGVLKQSKAKALSASVYKAAFDLMQNLPKEPSYETLDIRREAADVVRTMYGAEYNAAEAKKALIEIDNQDLIAHNGDRPQRKMNAHERERFFYNLKVGYPLYNTPKTKLREADAYNAPYISLCEKLEKGTQDPRTKERITQVDRIFELFTHIADNYGDLPTRDIEITDEDVERIAIALFGKNGSMAINPNFQMEVDLPINAVTAPEYLPEYTFTEALTNLHLTVAELFKHKDALNSAEFRVQLSANVIHAIKAMHGCDKAKVMTVPEITEIGQTFIATLPVHE